MSKREDDHRFVPVGRRLSVGSGRLVIIAPPARGHLAAQILLHGHPVSGRSVVFHREGDEKGTAGAPAGASLEESRIVTDQHGVARLPGTFPIGNYVCKVEDGPEEGWPILTLTTAPTAADVAYLSQPLGMPLRESSPRRVRLGVVLPGQPGVPPGHLRVRVLSHGVPVKGAWVEFFAGEDSIDRPRETDDHGISLVPEAQPSNTYQCAISHTDGAEDVTRVIVPTVPNQNEAVDVCLPGTSADFEY